jgi:putative peptide zinc metalloprotease protein
MCKHFGGECHEMGVMVLVLTPCLYCNVSDSWLLPNKWARAAIGAGGMYVELVLASIATWIWWFSEPGQLLNNLCLNVMFVCSVSTLIFNSCGTTATISSPTWPKFPTCGRSRPPS